MTNKLNPGGTKSFGVFYVRRRLMAERQVLALHVEVRILAPQRIVQ